MNRRFQKKLAAYFTPPPPVGKAAFLARLPQPTLSLGQFVGGQARYIQKQTWLLSLVVLVPVLWGTDLWITAALLPFLVPLAVSEGAKSTLYGMEELETASRFSRKKRAAGPAVPHRHLPRRAAAGPDLAAGGQPRPLPGPDGGLSAGPLPAHRLGQPVAFPPAPGREVLYGATALAVLASGSYSAAVFLADDLFALGALPGGAWRFALLAAALIGEGIAFAKRIKEGHMELVIRNLTKQYPNKLAVDGVNLTLRPGGVRLLGGQRAGKTTLMRMLCGILHPTGGGSPWTASPWTRRTTGPAWATCPRTLATTPASPGWTFSSTWGP